MLRSVLVTSIVVAALSFAGAQTKPKVKPKQKPKPTVTRALPGTVQMPGDAGKLGVEYGFGKDVEALNFTLDSAEFTDRLILAENTEVADKNHKFLVLRYSAHNPQKGDTELIWNSFQFTVVSPDNENEEFNGQMFHPERLTSFQSTLKPAQKMSAFVFLPIHPIGPVNKLIVKRGDGPVLRYDLRGKVKPLTGPFAAGDGVDIKTEGDGSMGKAFPVGVFDVTVESVTETTEAVGDNVPDDGNKLLVATLTIKNPGRCNQDLMWNTFSYMVKDTDGEECPWSQNLLGVNSNNSLRVTLKAGESIRAKTLFHAPKNSKPGKLMITDPGSERTITVPIP